MNLESEFIRLPYRFDAERMASEIHQFADTPWMAHPDRTDGNSALALISRGGGDNDELRGAMQLTPHLRRCPYLQQVIAGFGEVFGRSRLMRLEPGCEVVPHVDFHHHWHNHLRIHVPIITTPEVIFHCGDAQVHMQAGECWIFDSWRRHRVVNAGNAARVHLVIDTAGSSRFWERAGQALEAMRAGTPLVPQYLPYEPGAEARIVTERFNVQPVMSPGEVDFLTHDLIADFAALPDNDPEGVAFYRKRMLGFCKDWRALWYRYGLHRPGWPHYARLVAQTSRSLPEFDPPLLVRNRMCGARAAFGGRVLAVALARDVYEEFIMAEEPAAQAPGSTPVPAPGTGAGTQGLAPGRNDPCPCGSGRRYKHCHGVV
jgi:hypothetical protein